MAPMTIPLIYDEDDIDLSTNTVVADINNGNYLTTNNTLTLTGSNNNITPNWGSVWDTSSINENLMFGDIDDNKSKVFIVKPWQSKKPIEIEDGLWISLEEDLISNDDLKKKILDKLSETDPDILIRIGVNPDNIKLVKSEVNLEINKK